MDSNTKLVVIIGLLVLLAGCSGAPGGGDSTRTPYPTDTPTQLERNVTEISHVNDVGGSSDLTIIYDERREVYCYLSHVRDSSKIGTVGGISCLPANQTAVGTPS